MLQTYFSAGDAGRRVEGGMPDAEIDEALEETFPASDPPGWTLGIDPHPPLRDQADDPGSVPPRAD